MHSVFCKCSFDFDTNRVKVILSDVSYLSIDCIAVDNELAEHGSTAANWTS